MLADVRDHKALSTGGDGEATAKIQVAVIEANQVLVTGWRNDRDGIGEKVENIELASRIKLESAGVGYAIDRDNTRGGPVGGELDDLANAT